MRLYLFFVTAITVSWSTADGQLVRQLLNVEQIDSQPENFPQIDGFQWVPQLDGTLELMSDEEIQSISSSYEGTQFYNPTRDVKFTLYVNGDIAREVKLGDKDSLHKTKFDPNAYTIFLTHGWNGHGNDYSISGPRIQFLKMFQSVNVFQVDWSKGSSHWTYIVSKDRVKPTGKTVAEFINFLSVETKLHLNNVTLIGFSLGAHVVGCAGKEIYKTRGEKVGSIVGLDPAGPLFSIKDSSNRIAVTDADYVEIIHTNDGGLGLHGAYGHADIYVNGGRSQPGCGIDFSGNCAHGRAPLVYTESLQARGSDFWGRQCKDLKSVKSKGCDFIPGDCVLGGHPLQRDKGLCWLKTNKNQPFALGKP